VDRGFAISISEDYRGCGFFLVLFPLHNIINSIIKKTTRYLEVLNTHTTPQRNLQTTSSPHLVVVTNPKPRGVPNRVAIPGPQTGLCPKAPHISNTDIV
jgi:hypothetical protein